MKEIHSQLMENIQVGGVYWNVELRILEYYEALDTYVVNRDLQPFAEIVAVLEEQRLDEYLGVVCDMDMEGTDAGHHLEM